LSENRDFMSAVLGPFLAENRHLPSVCPPRA